MADAARVRRRPGPDRDTHLLHRQIPSLTRERDVRELRLRELGQLVEADELIGAALIVENRLFVLHMPERQRAPRGKSPLLQLLVPRSVRRAEPFAAQGDEV